MTTLTQHAREFEHLNVGLIAIARDSPKKIKEFQQDNQFAVQMMADKSGKVTKTYKVFSTGSRTDHLYLKFRLAIPTTYLINQKGTIVWRFVGTREERPSMELLKQAIRENL